MGGSGAGDPDAEGAAAAQSAGVLGPRARTQTAQDVRHRREEGGSPSRHRITKLVTSDVIGGANSRVIDTCLSYLISVIQ